MGLLLRRWLIVSLLAFAVSTAALAQTADIPAPTDNNLIVAVYNIQWLGQKEHDLGKLADVIEHFDVTGIIEVKKEDAVANLVTAPLALELWYDFHEIGCHLGNVSQDTKAGPH